MRFMAIPAAAVRVLALAGLATPAMQIIRSISEDVDMALVMLLRPKVARQFAECRSPQEAGDFWKRHIAGGRAFRAVAEQLYRVGLDYSDDSSYARWRKEVQVLLGAAVHTSFVSAGITVRATADSGAFTSAAQECLYFATLRLQEMCTYSLMLGQALRQDLAAGADCATMAELPLVRVALEGGELARRRVMHAELAFGVAVEDRRVAAVLRQLSSARLVVEGQDASGEHYVEPAHDALVSCWDSLWRWQQTEHESLRLQRRVGLAAQEWLRRGRERRPSGRRWWSMPAAAGRACRCGSSRSATRRPRSRRCASMSVTRRPSSSAAAATRTSATSSCRRRPVAAVAPWHWRSKAIAGW